MNAGNSEAPRGDGLSDNSVFVLSLDTGLRAQVLLDATPEFLASLTPELRAEAEQARQRQLQRIVEEEELEEERMQMRPGKKTKRKHLKYPEIEGKDFPDIPKEAA